MYYTYVLRCGDGNLYVGSTGNRRRRIVEHQSARLLVTLEYYEACQLEGSARLREKQLKTGFGRAYLKRRLYRAPFHFGLFKFSRQRPTARLTLPA
jgi:putative endonuclease